MTKIKKSLDYNKLLQQQAQGKLLKKILNYPLMAQTKYDGNYTVTEVRDGRIRHYTSGGLVYTHTTFEPLFIGVMDGYYLAERIAKEGQLGQRRYCALTGPKSNQKSTNHTYKVFDYITPDDYAAGVSSRDYSDRYIQLCNSGIDKESIVEFDLILTKESLYEKLKEVVNNGYEGLMLYQPDFIWKDTKSRTIDLCKLKSRPTVDLLCVGTKGGEGKYEEVIGSLTLQDKKGNQVSVGSGLSDTDRNVSHTFYHGKVIEIEYEQMINTYIQPTFIRVRTDKSREDID